ncbi:MAG: hypothetical protein NUV82_00150, partial [Candidatus Komeilibacteria bacterium]|nr:hypothetical protein [Candidatus Komeilibacteria bacterium]
MVNQVSALSNQRIFVARMIQGDDNHLYIGEVIDAEAGIVNLTETGHWSRMPDGLVYILPEETKIV